MLRAPLSEHVLAEWRANMLAEWRANMLAQPRANVLAEWRANVLAGSFNYCTGASDSNFGRLSAGPRESDDSAVN